MSSTPTEKLPVPSMPVRLLVKLIPLLENAAQNVRHVPTVGVYYQGMQNELMSGYPHLPALPKRTESEFMAAGQSAGDWLFLAAELTKAYLGKLHQVSEINMRIMGIITAENGPVELAQAYKDARENAPDKQINKRQKKDIGIYYHFAMLAYTHNHFLEQAQGFDAPDGTDETARLTHATLSDSPEKVGACFADSITQAIHNSFSLHVAGHTVKAAVKKCGLGRLCDDPLNVKRPVRTRRKTASEITGPA